MVKFGLGFEFRNPPYDERSMAEVYAESLDAIVLAEELGFDYVMLTEHHFVADGYCPSVVPLAAAIAARTKRIRIVPYVLLLPFHNPLRLAEDVAVVDTISNGRFELGVGSGYRLEEFAGFGIDRSERKARMDEGCEVMLKAWTEEGWSFEGEHWQFNNVTCTPKPVQRPHPVLWVSARAPAPARRAARFKAPLMLPPLQDCGLDGERASYEAWAEGLRAQGEDPADYALMGSFSGLITDDIEGTRDAMRIPGRYRRELYGDWFSKAGDLEMDLTKATQGPPPEVRALSGAVGDPETVIEGFENFLNRGIPYTHLATGGLHDRLDEKGRNSYMEAFAKHVIPHFRAKEV